MLSMVALLAAFGCSDDSPTEPVDTNQPPTISWTYGAVAVGVATTTTLTVAVDDPDGDAVTVTWSATGGALNSPQGDPDMSWTAPVTRGDVTITAVASDGKATREVSAVVKSATRRVSNIETTTTFLASQSPYLLDPPTTVFAIVGDQRLTVEPGVEIYVKPTAEIQVEGSLTTNGTAAQRIVIKPNKRVEEEGDWGGIRAVPGGTDPAVVDLTDTEISHAKEAVAAFTSASVTLRRCKITFSEQNAIHFQSNGTLVVEDCIITNNRKSGILIDGGVTNFWPAQVTIRGDSIALNGPEADSAEDAGIAININDPTGTVPIVIEDCYIFLNHFTGIRIGDPTNNQNHPAYPVITNNVITGNEFFTSNNRKVQMWLEAPFGVSTADTVWATGNYWFYSSESEIKNVIIDREDNPSGIQATVKVNPWLDVEP